MASLLSLGLRKIRQPKVIGEVLGGILLGSLYPSLCAIPQAYEISYQGQLHSVCSYFPIISLIADPLLQVAYRASHNTYSPHSLGPSSAWLATLGCASFFSW